MIKLYNKDFTTEYGYFDTLVEALVEEERNGLFELSFIILNTDSLFKYIEKENIVVCNANDTLLNQKFRIYNTRKLMNNRVEVYARHISFDLMYDYIDSVSFENQSCEYALNQLFRNSNFSQHYKGYSEIVSTQNYSMSNVNLLEAIGGAEGSIIDTYGNGAEILRDNENIHVLSKRGHDNSVTIEYRKNLTGFELEEDTTDLVTRILPYAKYTAEGQTEEITVKGNYIDSPYINNFSHPYIKSIDYSDKFEDEEIPTIEKLNQYAQLEYKNNKVDIPKQNYKIEFIPLSKCVGYEAIKDNISLCDTVTIKDTRYNINTQSKVIRTVYDVINNRYESIELGEPKTTLGDIIGNGNSEPVVGPPGPQGPPGKDGNLGDFPNSLPQVPILESFVYGFANIELAWTFENKVYYSYELYASKTKDFTPNTFDLIFEGQASSYLFQAKPNETWYFKVCAINTYGERTAFSNQEVVVTTKISDLSNYVDKAAIGEALIGTLSLDRGWIGKLNANLLDVKGNFSVTDGNGSRTIDIDSFGNVHINAKNLTIEGNYIAQEHWTNTQIGNSIDGLRTEVSNNYAQKSIFEQTVNDFNFKFENSNKPNLVPNGNPKGNNYSGWTTEGSNAGFYTQNPNGSIGLSSNNFDWEVYAWSPLIKLNNGGQYSVSFSIQKEYNVESADVYLIGSIGEDFKYDYVYTLIGGLRDNDYHRVTANIDIPSNIKYLRFRIDNNRCLSTDGFYCVYFNEFMLIEGHNIFPPIWYGASDEINNAITTINDEGIIIKNGGLKIQNNSGTDVLYGDNDGNLVLAGNLTSNASIHGGNIYGAYINGGKIEGNEIVSGTIWATNISGSDISGTYISGGTIEGNEIKGGHLTMNHNDGSYTKISAEGMYRYSSNENKSYHYLMHNGTVQSNGEVIVYLPNHISNKVGTNYSVSISARGYGFNDWVGTALQQLYMVVTNKTSTSFTIQTDLYGLKVNSNTQTIGGWVNIDYTIIG